mmetsp:Transcript_5913/g.17777  ORF Transcript_5913/g.17777 Transcript_5913/m.17777 type:complete len:541 (-) Transcript_5913:1016-2638(-)
MLHVTFAWVNTFAGDQRSSYGRRRQRSKVCATNVDNSNIVEKAQRAVKEYAERFRQAQLMAEQFRVGASQVVGADVELGRTADIEDVVVPPRDFFLKAPIHEVADALGGQKLLDLEERIVNVIYKDVRKLEQLASKGLKVGDHDSIIAFYELARRAGFRPLSTSELRRWSNLKQYPNSIPIATQKEEGLSMFDDALDDLIRPSNALYPKGIALWRGVGFQRDAGPLVNSKIRALQVSLFGWIQRPVNGLILKILELASYYKVGSRQSYGTVEFGGTEGSLEEDITEKEREEMRRDDKRVVRRVVLPATWKGGLSALGDFFLPTITQEPTAEHLLFLFLDEKEQNRSRPVRLLIYENVPFAGVTAYLPGAILIPSTFDALKLDVLTISGLFASLFPLFADMKNVYVFLIASGTVFQYAVRVFMNVQNMVQRYGTIRDRQQLRSLLARDAAGIHLLRDMVIKFEVKVAILVLGGLAVEDGGHLKADTMETILEDIIEDAFEEKTCIRTALERVIAKLIAARFIKEEGGYLSLTPALRDTLRL